MKTKKDKVKDVFELPDWFAGEVYNEGDILTIEETGEKLEVNNLELSMIDFVMGSQMIVEMMGDKITKSHIKYLNKGINWLKGSNPEIIKFININ